MEVTLRNATTYIFITDERIDGSAWQILRSKRRHHRNKAHGSALHVRKSQFARIVRPDKVRGHVVVLVILAIGTKILHIYLRENLKPSKITCKEFVRWIVRLIAAK